MQITNMQNMQNVHFFFSSKHMLKCAEYGHYVMFLNSYRC